MSVPLTVRIGDRLRTREARGLRFRTEAVGGVKSISFRLASTLANITDLPAFAPVYVFDSRSAKAIAQGNISDLGRGVDTDGQTWDLVAFGPGVTAGGLSRP